MDELTVPMSMRETENEINLLVPGGGLFDPAARPARLVVRRTPVARPGKTDDDGCPTPTSWEAADGRRRSTGAGSARYGRAT